ncbi:unnamed protein product [Danaus chrysippus]|uniref:(African queen) hypothetical protein n=1 Tax=Danaus chrysippus TaxID=151541 RepID=A0A8J2W0S4_9NEOP|nr:unnamed protein product [Danaus chrysippus]
MQAIRTTEARENKIQQYFLLNRFNKTPVRGVPMTAAMLNKLPRSDISISVMGLSRVVLTEENKLIVDEGQASMRPRFKQRQPTGKFQLITQFI